MNVMQLFPNFSRHRYSMLSAQSVRFALGSPFFFTLALALWCDDCICIQLINKLITVLLLLLLFASIKKQESPKRSNIIIQRWNLDKINWFSFLQFVVIDWICVLKQDDLIFFVFSIFSPNFIHTKMSQK